MELPIFIIDAFASQAFKGNPAAVCLAQNKLHEELCQKIAAEMNLSETAFITSLHSADDFSSGSRFSLRWFNPICETCLCGHATLASAAALFMLKKNPNPTIVFETMSGELYVRQNGDTIVMDFPLNKPKPTDLNDVKDIIQAAVGELPVQEVRYCGMTKMLMIVLSDSCDRTMLCSLKPDPTALLQCESNLQMNAILVTTKGFPHSGYDFYSRCFAPWHGVPEDPVCGSAHTVLGSYWSEKLNKKKLLAFQCSKRGGELDLSIRDDGRINITGKAVPVLKGILTL